MESILARRLIVAAIGLCLSLTPNPSRAEQPNVEQLLEKIENQNRRLDEREAVIADLLRRIEKLEQRPIRAGVNREPAPAQSAAQQAMATAQANASADERAAPAAQAPGDDRDRETAPPETEEVSQDKNDAEEEPRAPGQFEVDEEAAERALERTLVDIGALLVPFGKGEIAPIFSYTRRETDNPAFVRLAPPGQEIVVGGDQEVRRNELEPEIDLRIGLPFDTQFDIALPYQFIEEEAITRFFGRRTDRDGWGNGLGDLRLGLAKTLLREGVWRPDLIARFTWDSKTGETRDNDIGLGSGFNSVTGSLTALKRQDPLAFIGGAAYQKTFEDDNIEPGDELSFSLGAILAASPETSLRMVLSQSFTDDGKVDNQTINGSDQVQGVLTLGASSILGRGVLVDVAGGIGLTDDAPDYSIRISLPIRFNVPGL